MVCYFSQRGDKGQDFAQVGFISAAERDYGRGSGAFGAAIAVQIPGPVGRPSAHELENRRRHVGRRPLFTPRRRGRRFSLPN